MPQIQGVNVTQAEYDYQYTHRFESKKPLIIGLYSLFIFLALLSLLLRLWVQHLKRERYHRDDYAAILAIFFYFANTVVNICVSAIGDFGYHNIAQRPSAVRASPYLSYVGGLTYTLTWPMTKIAIVLLYLRIFPQKWFRVSCFFFLGIFVVYIIGTFFTDVFACSPVRKSWKPSTPGHCIDYNKLVLGTAIANVILDTSLIVMVQSPIWKLKIATPQKLGLSAIFGLGLLACAASAVRVSIIVGVQGDLRSTVDNHWHLAADLWASTELLLCILCVTLPCCYPLIDYARYKRRHFMSRSKSKPSTEVSPVGSSSRPGEPVLVSKGAHDSYTNGLTPSSKNAEIKSDATADRRFNDTPDVEDGTRLNTICVKSEVQQTAADR